MRPIAFPQTKEVRRAEAIEKSKNLRGVNVGKVRAQDGDVQVATIGHRSVSTDCYVIGGAWTKAAGTG